MARRHRHLPLTAEYRLLVVGDAAVANATLYSTIVDGHDCTLTFIDVATVDVLQHLNFSSVTPTACFLVFSITDAHSFATLKGFQQAIRARATGSIVPPMIIAANKIDLEHDRAVSQQAIDRLRLDGFDVFDISVKGNVGIGNAIQTAIKHLQYEENHRLEHSRAPKPCVCTLG